MNRTILERIVETKRREVADAKRARPLAELEKTIERATAPRDFYEQVTAAGGGIRLIGEIKKASPSAGLIRSDFDPVTIAKTYQHYGAAALSVLTDRTYFAGELSFIASVKRAVALPVLRKDFLIDEYQLFESRAAGADAVLLIAPILSPAQLRSFSDRARALHMTPLIEVHEVEQVRGVLDLIGPGRRVLPGVNNRDLRTQAVDLRATERVARELGPGVPFVSESGVKTRDDVERLKRAGATALLIGETIMRARDIGAKIRELMDEA